MTATDHVLTSDRRDFADPDNPLFRPRCSCGWSCPRWVDRDTATHRGDDHLAANQFRNLGRLRAAVNDPAPDRRAALVADLRALADWLEAHPEVPVPRWGSVEVTYHPAHDDHIADDDAAFSEVHRIAGLIGATVEEDSDRAAAYRAFGSAGYKAIAISSDHMARYSAGTSYLYVVEPDMAVAR